jgi:hypothetical protein
VGLIVVALGLIVVISLKMFSTPEPVAVAPVPAAPVAPAAKPGGTAAAPPATAPPAANEALPPREAKAESAKPDHDRPAAVAKAGRPTGKKGREAGGRGTDEAINNRLSGAFTSPPPKAAEAPRKPKDDIEALLEAASGGRKSAPRREAADEAPAPSSEKLPPLGREEIVKGMNGVLPKARDCFAQFKVPGTANAKITVDPRGRVTGVNVSGKFAGTPSGNCVEGAIKTARFAPSSGLTFDYPVPLR